jgi:acyl carrier protein
METDAMDVIDRLRIILLDLGIPSELIHPDALLAKDLQIDSAEVVEISLELKRQFGVNVKLESKQDKTLVELCRVVEAMLNAGTTYVS